MGNVQGLDDAALRAELADIGTLPVGDRAPRLEALHDRVRQSLADSAQLSDSDSSE